MWYIRLTKAILFLPPRHGELNGGVALTCGAVRRGEDEMAEEEKEDEARPPGLCCA